MDAQEIFYYSASFGIWFIILSIGMALFMLGSFLRTIKDSINSAEENLAKVISVPTLIKSEFLSWILKLIKPSK